MGFLVKTPDVRPLRFSSTRFLKNSEFLGIVSSPVGEFCFGVLCPSQSFVSRLDQRIKILSSMCLSRLGHICGPNSPKGAELSVHQHSS